MQEFEIDTKPSRKTGKQKFYDFLYNEDTNEILGRTPKSWGKDCEFVILQPSLPLSVGS